MPFITLNSNVPALQARRRLDQSTRSLSVSLERLSSGLRINRASDDAAGLAIADSLSTDTRVFGQAVRNANDAVSLLAIAEGAVQSLSTSLLRMRELAEQSANGTLSNAQRAALHQEAAALREEYNRIVASTEFNGLNPTDASLGSLSVQVGFGVDGSISFSAGQELAATVGTGDFGAENLLGSVSDGAVATGDFNGDGHLDYLAGNAGIPDAEIFLGDGEGNFTSAGTLTVGGFGISSATTADVDNNGTVDVIIGGNSGFTVFKNDGNANFSAGVLTATLGTVQEIAAGDFDNDGSVDILASTSSSVYLATNDGSGSFTLNGTAVSSGMNFDVGDFDGDGNLDFAATIGANNTMFVNHGNGDGTFSTSASLTAISKGADIQVADVNLDGKDDIITLRTGNAHIYFSNGDETFTSGSNFAFSFSAAEFITADINNDGYTDLVGASGNRYEVLLNNQSGVFDVKIANLITPAIDTLIEGDFNGDGALDLLFGGSLPSDSIVFALTEEDSTLQAFSLLTQDDALQAMSVIDQAMERVSGELGALGSVISRLSSTVRVLSQTSENYRTAESRIRDIDVADETANLVRSQILQQAGAAILGQANILPELALTLLGE